MSHISFSELKCWNDCAYKHKLMYIDRVQVFKGNEYTAFGKALHEVCEHGIKDPSIKLDEYFLDCFEKEINRLDQIPELRQNLIESMFEQGPRLALRGIPALKKEFGAFKIISTEERLQEKISFFNSFDFKGFIDLVIQTEDGKYHIIDWKTCSWGWDSKKRSDPMITYQLTLYKHFFAEKHNIDPKDIETYFALLKRTAKNNMVEIFRVTSGKKKTENALNLVNKALYNISRGFHIKNRLSCIRDYGCEFYKTKHCQ